MWRSEPQIPVASTRTSASSAAAISGSGFSSTRTSSGAWKVTARMGARTVSRPGRFSGEAGALLDLEAVGPVGRARRLGDPRLERQLFLEVRRLGVLEGDVVAFDQLDEDLDEF